MKITKENLIFRPISNNDNISHFYSANDDLNDFLKDDAREKQISMLSVTWLVFSNDAMVSYFSLTNDSIQKKLLHPGDGESDYEYSHYPALKIARLAVHKEYEGQGIGTAMLIESVTIAFTIAKYAGCRIVTVDAKKEAAGFYEKYGFKKSNTGKDTATIPMYLDLNKMT